MIISQILITNTKSFKHKNFIVLLFHWAGLNDTLIIQKKKIRNVCIYKKTLIKIWYFECKNDQKTSVKNISSYMKRTALGYELEG